MKRANTGFANIGKAKIYFESADEGQPLIFIHAGIADSRQWNNEFGYFSKTYRVIRYDMRGYGKSEPVGGEYSNLEDLVALLDILKIDEPITLVGCSMGGSLAMDFSLAYPSRARKLIMVASGPSGLDLDEDEPANKFEEAGKAMDEGDLDLAAEIETQIWFDGMNREPGQVNQEMRKLLFEMNRIALSNEAREIGKRLPNMEIQAYQRLGELNLPVLVIVGANDIPYMQAAADYMMERIPSARKVVIENAAHLPNMEHPDEFRRIVQDFISD